MSEPALQPADEPVALDAVSLAALVSSRICHDLINPVGALSTALEALDDEDLEEGMREEALGLVRSSVDKSIALLKYARLAYGAAGGYGAEISLDDAREVLSGVYATAKARLDWRLAGGHAPKDQAKALLILAHAAADSVPRGGVVTVSGAPDDFTVVAEGERVFLNDELVAALKGDAADMKPKFAPIYLAGLAARASGGAAAARLIDGRAVFAARFGPR